MIRSSKFTAVNTETGEKVRLYEGHKAFVYFEALCDDVKSQFKFESEWWLSLGKQGRRNYTNAYLRSCWTEDKVALLSNKRKGTPHWTKSATADEVKAYKQRVSEFWTDERRVEKGKAFSKMWADMPDDKKALHSERVKASYSIERREALRKKGIEFESNLTEEQKEARSKKFRDAMTLEKRLELRAKSKASYDAKTADEKIQHRLNAKRAVARGVSAGELEMFNFIKECLPNVEVVGSCNDVLDGLELDVYIPQLNIAFEYNGVWWHSDKVMDKYDNYKKFVLCARKGIRLIQIWESDWSNKRKIVEDLIRSALGVNSNLIYARDCKLTEIDSELKNKFLKDNHIQGEDRSFLSTALLYNDSICAVMTFRKSRNNKDIELSRYCGNVVGGFSRLLKFATPLLKCKGISELISYSENILFSGNVYEQNGWEFVKELSPDYKVFYKGTIFHKSAWRKELIYKRFPFLVGGGKTEWEMEDEVGALRLWDCGKKKWKFYL